MSTSDYLTGSKEDHDWLVLLVNGEHNRGSSQTSSNVVRSQQRACDILYMIHNSGFLQQQKEAMTVKNKKTKLIFLWNNEKMHFICIAFVLHIMVKQRGNGDTLTKYKHWNNYV